MKIRHLAPDGIAAALLLAFLATAGIVYINIMQALVTGLADGLHIGSARAGAIGAANAYGGTLGALAGVLLVPRLEWKRTAVVLLFALLALDLISAAVSSSSVLIAVRFVHGTAGGMLVATGYSVIARLRDPDRGFGISFVIQYALGGVGNTWLPGLAAQFGVQILFISMAAFSVVTLAMLPFLGPYPAPAMPAGLARPTGTARLGLLLPAIAALFLFQAGNMLVGAYTISLGRSAGLDLSFASRTVGAASWVGLAGAALVALFSTRFGRAVPVAIAFAVTLIATWLFHRSGNASLFVAANFGAAAVWGFVLSYLFGMCSQLDRRGFAAMLGGLGAKLGAATGILVGSRLLGPHEKYASLIDAALLVLFLSAAFAVPTAIALDRRDAPGTAGDSRR